MIGSAGCALKALGDCDQNDNKTKSYRLSRSIAARQCASVECTYTCVVASFE